MDPEKSNDIREQIASLGARLFREDGGFDGPHEALYVVLCEAGREYLSACSETEDGKWTTNQIWGTLQSLFENLAPQAVDYSPEAPLRMVDFEKAVDPLRWPSGDRHIVSVYAIYQMTRVEGQYNARTREFRILRGLASKSCRTYKSPSGASSAVIRELNPKVSPVRKWQTFWKVLGDGRDLGNYLTQEGIGSPSGRKSGKK